MLETTIQPIKTEWRYEWSIGDLVAALAKYEAEARVAKEILDKILL